MRNLLLSLVLLLSSMTALAASVQVPMYLVAATGHGKKIGTITLQDTKYGLLVIPKLNGLKSGLHGLHIHDKPSCSDMGQAAAGHFDPANSGKHLGPFNNDGHLGDLPALYVDKKGKADLLTIAPRLSVAKVKDHALMIHAGGDNYSDKPEKLGGGGARVACGIIK